VRSNRYEGQLQLSVLTAVLIEQTFSIAFSQLAPLFVDNTQGHES
jgi:hypothetical protein